MPAVLIIDDNRHIRTQIKLVLKLEGYDTFESENGLQAVEMARTTMPDLIVCDIIMPELDGYGVLEQLRSQPETADIPFLFLSAKADRSDIREGMNLGADDYLVKPFSAQELVQAISARLERHQVSKRQWERRVESLHQLSKHKDRFLSLMSHDLKSSFAGVMGLSEMLASKLDDLSFDRLQEISVLMKDAVHSTNNLLQSFVEWSRLQNNGMMPVKQSVNIGELALTVLMQHTGLASHKLIDLHSAIPPDTHVWADPNMTQVIIRNLLSNALKFTSPGGRITIGAEEVQPQHAGEKVAVRLVVQDTGVGMSPEVIQKLMNADVSEGIHLSTPGTHGEKGTGLGLMFCRELLEKQGGELSIQSELGKGSVISFTLPKAP